MLFNISERYHFKCCKYLKIYPVNHGDKIVRLEVNEAVSCNKTFVPIHECVVTTSERICKPTISKCLSELLNQYSP